MMKMISILMSTTMMITKHPLIMSMIIIMTCMSLTPMMYMHTKTQWIPYIITLTFLGGMMILFTYISSLIPNKKTSNWTNKMTSIVMILPLVITLNMNSIPNNSDKMHSMNSMYQSNWNSMVMIMIIIMTVMMLMTKMILNPFKPMKSNK